MINKVGRDIPEEILKATGKKIFEGAYVYDNFEYKKAAPVVRAVSDPRRSKMVTSIREVLEKCDIRDGMTLSFHHHFREGDYVVNMVMEEIHQMGIKDLTI
ncbi:MAG: citrate lyase subunit alpha, partial [[Clostridium] symbiosum]